MKAVHLDHGALRAITDSAGRMFFGVATPVEDGLQVTEHVSLPKSEIDDDVRANLLCWASKTGDALLECHVHLHGDPACMSRIDLAGLAEWAPHVRWRLGGRPYVALVLAETTLDGVAWIRADNVTERIDVVYVGSERIHTTGRSVERIHREDVRDAVR